MASSVFVLGWRALTLADSAESAWRNESTLRRENHLAQKAAPGRNQQAGVSRRHSLAEKTVMSR